MELLNRKKEYYYFSFFSFLSFYSFLPIRSLLHHSTIFLGQPRPRRDTVYALSEACFGGGVRQNSLSRGRITPKGIYAICIVQAVRMPR